MSKLQKYEQHSEESLQGAPESEQVGSGVLPPFPPLLLQPPPTPLSPLVAAALVISGPIPVVPVHVPWSQRGVVHALGQAPDAFRQ